MGLKRYIIKRLAEIAVIHSMDMARQGYFAHTSLDGTTMGQRVLPYWDGGLVGENIAIMAPASTRSFSPGPSRDRATENDGL